MISIDRILAKEDEYLSKNDYDSAERHLEYWLGEARLQGDGRAILLIDNELIGLHRKLGHQQEALGYCQKALERKE